MDTHRNSSILDDFPKMSIHIIEQLMKLYKARGNYWKDGRYKNDDQNPGIWPIFQGEALRTILMLCRSFPEAKQMVLANQEYKKVIADTLERLVQKVDTGQYDAAPYFDSSRLDSDPNQPFVFIESLYTAGAVFLYSLLVFGDEDDIIEDKEVVADLLQSIVRRLKKAYIKEKDKKTAAWGFCEPTFKPNFYDFKERHHYELLYFTYNSINFITLLSDSNAGSYIKDTNLKAMKSEFFGEIKEWLEKDFLEHPEIGMLSNPIRIQVHEPAFVDTPNYRIYNNLYVVNSLLLLDSEQDDTLEKAVKWAARYVIDRYDSDFAFSSELGYPTYEFPLTGRLYDDESDDFRREFLMYDDRSIHTLVLMSLCLLAQRKAGKGEIDPELTDMIAVSYGELLKLRSTNKDFPDLWDSISNPSIYYCVRAVDAITEFHALAKSFGDIPVVSSEQQSAIASPIQGDIRKIVRSEIKLFFKGLLESNSTDRPTPPTPTVNKADIEALVKKSMEEQLNAVTVDGNNKLGNAEERLMSMVKELDDKIKPVLEKHKQKGRKEREDKLSKGKEQS